jgi:type III pantothenate kinase
MILAIDAGNSRVKWGWLETAIDGRGRLEHDSAERNSTANLRWSSIATVSLIEFAASGDHVNPFSVTHEAPESIVISNVAGEGAHQLLVNWTSIFEAAPLWLRAEPERFGVKNLYEHPEQLGPDRWAALIAARGLHSGSCLVVNAGTATTVDMLTAEGTFLGGAILPGVELMRFVLHEHTGRLPIEQGSLREKPRNTLDAIETGCRHAQAGAIERMYRAFRELDTNPLCIVSGGAGRPLMDQLSAPRRYVENLVLDGLARIALGAAASRDETGAMKAAG